MSGAELTAFWVAWPVVGIVCTAIVRNYSRYPLTLLDVICGAILSPLMLFIVVGYALSNITLWYPKSPKRGPKNQDVL